ncbi:QVR superfamily protein rtv [Brevipalpus obovatus]|uniref:QVR superfamily protein rtv n=1 Tax=Brevipalpus obovatus TaxID=246614 RepID=UPI003D9FA63B
MYFNSVYVSSSLFIAVIWCLLTFCTPSIKAVNYCYTCRSRGSSTGDCGDPFHWNHTTLSQGSQMKPVELSPCPSGWCGKIIEGKDNDPIQATERLCLLRPPADQIERCSDTIFESRTERLFMCFCRGNLCNGSTSMINRSHLAFAGLFTLMNLIVNYCHH